MKSKQAISLLLPALLALGLSSAAFADGDSDVVIQKNPDGTVDAFDKPSAGGSTGGGNKTTHGGHGGRGSAGGPQETNVHYRLYNPQGTRHINGVSVHTNSDGSIETSDGESSPEPVHHSASHAAAHSVAKKKHK